MSIWWKRASNVLLLMLKHFGLHGPPGRPPSEPQGASENCHLNCFGWNSTCVILFINIFIQNHINILWRAWGSLKKVSWQLFLFCWTASQKTTWVSSQFSLSVRSGCSLTSKSFSRERTLLQSKLHSQASSPENQNKMICKGPQSHLWENICHLNVCKVLR